MVPIQTPLGSTVGTISIDTLQLISSPPSSDEQQQICPSSTQPATLSTSALSASSSFQDHEALFYQGVGQCVGEVHHWISSRLSLLRVSLSALRWIHNHCPAVKRGEVYLVTEGSPPPKSSRHKAEPFLLHLMLCTTLSNPPTTKINKIVKKQDNPFKLYLFECVEMSEPFSTEIFGDRHLVHPIRDHTGCAVALVDLTVTTSQGHSLNGGQLREITKVLNLITSTFYYLNSTQDDSRSRNERDMGIKMELSVVEDVISGTYNILGLLHLFYKCIDDNDDLFL